MDMMVKTIAKIGDKARLKNRFNNCSPGTI